jgi:hypothetical protein
MAIHSGNATVQRREERLLRERLADMEAKLDRALAMEKKEVGATAPAFPQDSDIEEVGRLLVEGRIRLPTHARLTVITTVAEVRHKLFNTTTDVMTHTADQLHTRLLRPMTVLEALEGGLIRRVERGWVWSEATYERLAKAAQGVSDGVGCPYGPTKEIPAGALLALAAGGSNRIADPRA